MMEATDAREQRHRTFATWVKAHTADLLRYASARVKQRAVAEDLVQLTFVAAWETMDRFAGESSRRTPRPQGGDRRSDRIEAYAEEVLALIEERSDITLAEIAEHLEERHGERFAPSTIWRCLDRHDKTFKKNGARQRAGSPRRGPPAGRLGAPARLSSIPAGWCSSTRPGPPPR